MKSLQEFNEFQQSKGRYTFRKKEALEKLGISSSGFNFAAHKLFIKEKLYSLRTGFYLIVPAEYLHSAPPPTWYIDDLMNYLKQPYYVGLLSAGHFLGAAHHQPQEFHVITNKPTRELMIKNSRTRFFQKTDIRLEFTDKKKSPTGYIIISGPELTAVDLVRYASKIGGLDLVGTVLHELTEEMDSKKLIQVAESTASMATLQRLGFILDHLEHYELSKPLEKWLNRKNLSMTVLSSMTKKMSGPRDEKWKIIVNDQLEIET